MIKIAVVGHVNSGKSTFCQKICEPKESPPKKSDKIFFELHQTSGTWLGKKWDINLWDISDLQMKEPQMELIFKDLDVIIIAFDVSSQDSFSAVGDGIACANRFCNKAKKVLLACKTDLPCSMSVS